MEKVRPRAAQETKASATWRHIDAFATVLLIACALSLVAGISGVIGLGDWRGVDGAVVVAASEVAFAVMCAVLVLLHVVRGARASWSIFSVALAMLLSLLVYEDTTGILWVPLFPPLAIYGLGRRRGTIASVALGVFFVIVSLFARAILPGGGDARLVIAALYVAALVGAAYESGLVSKARAAVIPAREMVEEAEKTRRDVGTLVAALGKANSENDDIVVLYRRESMQTIARIPDPEAVFSYLLLEGLAGQSDSASLLERPDIEGDGGYDIRAVGIDDLLDKAEAIIDAREAKKLIEFNKIQAQIDSALSRDAEDGATVNVFEQKSAAYAFSEREVAVAQCILRGLSNKEISAELFISVETVKTHVKNLFKKCDVNNRIDFIKLFSRM